MNGQVTRRSRLISNRLTDFMLTDSSICRTMCML